MGELESRSPFLEVNSFIQLVSLEETWSLAVSLDAVNIKGILKNTLLSFGGEDTMSSFVRIIPLHSPIYLNKRDIVWNVVENSFFNCEIVELKSPPWI